MTGPSTRRGIGCLQSGSLRKPATQLPESSMEVDPAVIHVLRRICGVRDVKPREAANPKVAIPAKAKTPLEAPHPQMSVDELEDYCSCPITAGIMVDPVMTEDGHTYERRAITEWLAKRNTSPRTGLVLKRKALRPNLKVQQALQIHYPRGASGRAIGFVKA